MQSYSLCKQAEPHLSRLISLFIYLLQMRDLTPLTITTYGNNDRTFGDVYIPSLGAIFKRSKLIAGIGMLHDILLLPN